MVEKVKREGRDAGEDGFVSVVVVVVLLFTAAVAVVLIGKLLSVHRRLVCVCVYVLRKSM